MGAIADLTSRLRLRYQSFRDRNRPASPFAASTFRDELIRILAYWQQHAPDEQRGGFHGRVTFRNRPDPAAPRPVVVTARILWTFSMAYRLLEKPAYRTMADRAYRQLTDHFIDIDCGGVYWSTSPNGTPLETKKLIYGQAFALYGLTEYHRATGHAGALEHARCLFDLIERHAFDAEHAGYAEAFNRDWSSADDLVLSSRPWTKSANAHLHLLEAYTNLFAAHPDARVAEKTADLMRVIMTRCVNPESGRMHGYFDARWTPKDGVISYGHDIEASWLLCASADVLADPALAREAAQVGTRLAEAACTGLGPDGALDYELDPATGRANNERAWWVAAEQLVGFYNAYQVTGRPEFLRRAERTWRFIDRRMIDRAGGEWHGVVNANGRPRVGDKIHFWKCPYHNARACAEMWQRVGQTAGEPSGRLHAATS